MTLGDAGLDVGATAREVGRNEVLERGVFEIVGELGHLKSLAVKTEGASRRSLRRGWAAGRFGENLARRLQDRPARAVVNVQPLSEERL